MTGVFRRMKYNFKIDYFYHQNECVILQAYETASSPLESRQEDQNTLLQVLHNVPNLTHVSCFPSEVMYSPGPHLGRTIADPDSPCNESCQPK